MMLKSVLEFLCKNPSMAQNYNFRNKIHLLFLKEESQKTKNKNDNLRSGIHFGQVNDLPITLIPCIKRSWIDLIEAITMVPFWILKVAYFICCDHISSVLYILFLKIPAETLSERKR